MKAGLVAAGALTLIGAAAVLALSVGGSDPTRALPTNNPTPFPLTIHRNGKTFNAMLHGGIEAAATDEKDPRLLYVFVVDQSKVKDPNCRGLYPTAGVTRSDAKSVTVDTAVYIERRQVKGPQLCGYEVRGYLRLPVRLDAPLGSRRLLDRLRGNPVQVLDASTIPTPRYVPPGYRLEPVTLEETFDPDPYANKAEYHLVRVLRSDREVIEIRAGTLHEVPPSSESFGAEQVGEYAAAVENDLSGANQGACLRWLTGPDHAIQLCSEPTNLRRGAPPSVPILRVARSLR
jgi:hypothetical protein